MLYIFYFTAAAPQACDGQLRWNSDTEVDGAKITDNNTNTCIQLQVGSVNTEINLVLMEMVYNGFPCSFYTRVSYVFSFLDYMFQAF